MSEEAKAAESQPKEEEKGIDLTSEHFLVPPKLFMFAHSKMIHVEICLTKTTIQMEWACKNTGK